MKVSTEKVDNQEVVLEITVETADVAKALRKAYNRIANRVNIPGFRKGKAPSNIIERYVGKQAILDEAFEIVAPKALIDAFEQEHIEPVTRPKIDIVTLEDGKDLVFTAKTTPKPEVTLGEYKGLKIAKEPVNITDEDVDKQIEVMRNRQGKLVDAPEGAEAKEGDLITLDFEGFIDGEPFEGNTGKDYPLRIGSNTLIKGFEEQLIGAKAGEEREVNVTFPEDYHAQEIAGKDAKFNCVVHSIKNNELPELDDEFAKKVSTFKTLDELKADVRDKLTKAAELKAENDQKSAAIQKAADNITVDIPPVMLDNRVDAMLEDLAARLEQQRMDMESYLQYAGTDIAKLREEYREAAEKNIRTDLMLEAVAKAENVAVEDADRKDQIAQMAATYGVTLAQVRKIIRDNERASDLDATILRRKTAQLIIDSIVDGDAE